MSDVSVKRIGFAAGAEIRGVDLRKPVGAREFAAIEAAWTEHQVLVFPGQDLLPDDLVNFTSLFGDVDQLESQPFSRLEGFKQVMLLSNRPVNGKLLPGAAGGQNWHTDLSYTLCPAEATFLYCLEKPDLGGDTLFANMYMAYESLSPRMQALLASLEAVHDVGLINAKRAPEIIAEFKRLNPPVVHPAVRIHPKSKKPALYVNDRVRTFVGMTEEESKPIIQFLCAHATKPKFTYRHHWSVGDLVVWDNRCLTHMAVGDFDPGQVRHMIRTSTVGKHVGRLESPAPAAERGAVGHEAVAAALSAMHD